MAVLAVLIKNAASKPQKLKLLEDEFRAVGARDSSGYTFNLEIVDGKVVNNIAGTAVARDLIKVLTENKSSAQQLKDRRIKISMGKAFEVLITSIE